VLNCAGSLNEQGNLLIPGAEAGKPRVKPKQAVSLRHRKVFIGRLSQQAEKILGISVLQGYFPEQFTVEKPGCIRSEDCSNATRTTSLTRFVRKDARVKVILRNHRADIPDGRL
jgi:hypothetical protein